MKNQKKIKQIKQSWFGSWVSGLDGSELLMFHLTDDATIIFTVWQNGYDVTDELPIEEFEKRFSIDINELLNSMSF
ncbi:hypothetical protein M0P65_07070 [Candidatus Gracilibacteria bacterium]|jgi:hypothetical protein|nr:hypothetical protein [Candidatus Gracilibacteria bacterium]